MWIEESFATVVQGLLTGAIRKNIQPDNNILLKSAMLTKNITDTVLHIYCMPILPFHLLKPNKKTSANQCQD